MATKFKYKCPACGEKEAKSPAMFKALKRLAEGASRQCQHCNADMRLHLSFSFALGAKKKDAIAIASYFPDPLPKKWTDDKGREVTFIPFLVIVERSNGERAAWLPYFHVLEEGKKTAHKYGQWAPFMKMDVFEDLLQQARKAGYLLADDIVKLDKPSEK